MILAVSDIVSMLKFNSMLIHTITQSNYLFSYQGCYVYLLSPVLLLFLADFLL